MQQIPAAVTLASRSDRWFAQAIDGIVGSAPVAIGAFVASRSLRFGGIALAIGICWAIFYYLFADGFKDGQSLGKRRIGMRVVDARTGAPCTFLQSCIRNSLTLLGPIDYVFILGERHQRLGDKAAGTIVIYD